MMRSGSGRCTARKSSSARWRRSARGRLRCVATTSSICRPIVISGLSAAIGSWKIMAISPPRICRSRAALAASRFSPLKRMRPALTRSRRGGSNPRMLRAITDLPEPDSPTTQRISFSARARPTSSTACGRSAPGGRSTVRPLISRRGAGISERPQARVQRVVEALADEVDGEDRKQNGDAGNGAEPPRRPQIGAAGADHEAPAHDVGIAEAEKGQSRFDEDRRRDEERAGDDDGREAVRQDLAEDHLEIAHAEHDRGLDEFAPPQAEELAANEARDGRPADDGDGDDGAGERWAEDGDEHDGEDEGGDRLEELGEAHQQVVDESAIEAGEGADEGADEERRQCRDEADHQRGAGAMSDPRRHVAAERVRAEEMRAEGRQERLVDDGEGIARKEDRGARREDQHEDEDGKTDETRPARREALPERRADHRASIRGSSSV